MPRRLITWESIYYRHIRAGDDPAYALFAADEWQKRQEQRKMSEEPMTNPYQGQPQQVPSVGRIVHYVSHGSPDGTHPAGEHRAAIITAVPPYIALPDADQTVTLTVFNPNGFYVGAAAPYDPTAQVPGSWHWPEYVPAKG